MSIARFRCAGAILVGICFLFVGAVCAQQKAAPKKAEKGEEGEVKVAMKDLPKEVQATVQKETKGATVVGLSMETEGGKTTYEAETKVNGKGRDISIDAKGNVIEVEEEIDLASLPAAVQVEVKNTIGKAKLLKLESVFNGAKVQTGFEASVDNAGKHSEIEMGLDGKVLAKGK